MITFYNRSETDFSHNGFGCLDNFIINPCVCQDLNGIFLLEFDYPLSGAGKPNKCGGVGGFAAEQSA